jgi:transposase
MRDPAADVERLDVTPAHLRTLLDGVREKVTAAEYRELEALVDTVLTLVDLLARKNTSLARLRRVIFGAATEKTREVLARVARATASPRAAAASPSSASGPARSGTATGIARVGHGRRGAGAYPGAQMVTVVHPMLRSGDACPACGDGKVYVQREPTLLLRFVGQAPVGATVYALDRLRCHLCGTVFRAPTPEGVGDAKYDETVGAMIAQLKYGSGVPFHRLAQLQTNIGLPLPPSTQWEIVAAVAVRIAPLRAALVEQAAQGTVIYNDDTDMTVLSLLPGAPQTGAPRRPALPPMDPAAAPPRTGVFTSGIVATHDGHRVALYFTGRRHAGENLATVLRHRASALGPPIQMCDALARNVPEAFATVLANCLCHARRNVVDVAVNFPEESRYVLDTLRDVYRHDAEAREQGLSPEARLAWHQQHSQPLMDRLQAWCEQQLAEHLTEPHSGLGEAITYFVRHWTKLTRFLTVAGAPLDSNLVERALKKAILHRKGALFYKTEHGARVGDFFMSVVHTCELNGINAFEYLVTLQRHADALRAAPGAWLPWTYRATLQALAATSAA